RVRSALIADVEGPPHDGRRPRVILLHRIVVVRRRHERPVTPGVTGDDAVDIVGGSGDLPRGLGLQLGHASSPSMIVARRHRTAYAGKGEIVVSSRHMGNRDAALPRRAARSVTPRSPYRLWVVEVIWAVTWLLTRVFRTDI